VNSAAITCWHVGGKLLSIFINLNIVWLAPKKRDDATFFFLSHKPPILGRTLYQSREWGYSTRFLLSCFVYVVMISKPAPARDLQQGHASCAFNGRINLSHSFIVQFYSTVLYDNFQNCSINLWHNFMRQFYTRFFSTDHSELHPFFHVFRILKWCTLERIRLYYKTVG